MKLHNKNTGEIFTNPSISVAPYTNNVRGCHIKTYRSIAELNEEWEDYDLDEPFIEHEDIRKALRWWAVSNGITNDASLLFVGASNGFTCENQYISFDSAVYDMSEKLISGNTYELAELCGKEEE